MPENPGGPEQYRGDLAGKLRQVRDKEERRGILAEESETQEYQETREAHDASRREVLTEKERQEQLVREKEKAEYLEEVRRLELELELKIADANRLVDQVFAGFSGSVSEVPPPASLETVDEQIKALDEKAMGGRGYLEGASQAFLQLRKLEADLRADIGSRGAAKAQLSARIAEVQTEITALKTGGLIKRFRARSEIAERQGRVGNMNRDIAASEKTVRKENSTLAKIAMQKLDFGGRVCDLLKREIDGTAAREIGQSLKELWDKVSGTTFFAEDVGAAYMEQVIAPAFDRVAAEREAHRHEHSFYRDMPGWYEAEKNRSRFFALLKKRLAGKNEEMGETEALREMMASLPSELSSVCQPLLQDVVFLGGRNAIKPIVRSLFAQYAAERISAAVDGVKKKKEKMSETEAADPADAHIRSQLMPDYALRFPESYDGLPSDVEWDIRSGGTRQDELPDVALWTVAKKAPSVRVFGDAAEVLDKKYSETILGKSLTDLDGKFIDNLYYYPNPDSIKTLVLLAAADAKSYRTVHANWALARLARLPDWPQLLDEAERKYPELRQTREALENWKVGEFQERNPEVVERAADLAASLLEKEPENKLQKRLAEEALPNDRLIAILEKRGNVPPQDIEMLKKAEEITKNSAGGYTLCQSFRKLVHAAVEFVPPEGGTTDLSLIAKGESSLVAILAIAKKVVEAGEDPNAMNFLTSSYVINSTELFISDAKRGAPKDLDVFLSAYKDLPDLHKEPSMIMAFCEYFTGSETVEFYKRIYESYREKLDSSDRDVVSGIARAVGGGSLTPDRAIALSGPVKTSRGEVDFLRMSRDVQQLGLCQAGIFLKTDDGLDFLDHIRRSGGVDGLSPDLDGAIGGEFVRDRSGSLRDVVPKLGTIEFAQRIRPMLADGKTPEVDATNWKEPLMAFVSVAEGEWAIQKEDAERIKKMFEAPGAKDTCLVEMRELWRQYLEGGKLDDFPFSLQVINEHVRRAGGAGPLSQVESLSTFTDAYCYMLYRKSTAPRTKKEIAEGLAAAEGRFAKERWANEDIADFYNVSRDVIRAAPSLFSEYFDLFQKLKPKDFKEFSQVLFPLHRVIISLSGKRERGGGIAFDKKDMVRMRDYVGDVVDGAGNLKPVEVQKRELTERILEMFTRRFGIVKIPENLTQEHIRALSDMSLYLANLSGSTVEKEDILGFYLALTINDRWDDYRRGVAINPEEYLTAEKAARLKPYLEKRDKLSPVTAENVGVSAEQMPEFMKVLQEESENVTIGNVETVDVKLNNVIANIRGLEDLDLYPDALDKERMRLLVERGNKKIGAVSAKMYQLLARPERRIELSEEEAEIRKEIESALANNGLALTAENVKRYFQDEIRPLAVVANISYFVEEIGAEREIAELRDVLKPSGEVIAVFNKMGEEFKPTSGAIAISQDLEYLDNLIVKKSGELSEQEADLVRSYIAKVREKLAALEDIYDLIGKKFASMKQGQTGTKNELLKSKLEDISNIINMPESQHIIASTMTNNLPHIIENIRECLSCVRQGANNDTNLTFGDPNRFYLSSRSEMRAGSISDELVFFEPVTFPDGSKEMAFVLDRIYGTNTPAILLNQIETVYKKYAKMKQAFPGATVSIFVSSSAIQSGGMSARLLIEKIQEKTGGKAQIQEAGNVEVNVVESAAGDHYVEFGGNARSAGPRNVGGVTIRL